MAKVISPKPDSRWTPPPATMAGAARQARGWVDEATYEVRNAACATCEYRNEHPQVGPTCGIAEIKVARCCHAAIESRNRHHHAECEHPAGSLWPAIT